MTKERPLSGQVALVTGGGKGIGRAIGLELAARGARVLVTGRSERSLGEAVGEIAFGGGTARHRVADVRDAASARAAVSQAIDLWGGLHIVVANAGVTGTAYLGGAEAEDEAERSRSAGARLDRAKDILETNLLGAYYLFDAAAERMRGPGRLVAISSVLGKFGAPGQGAYAASKAGLHGLVRSVALELAPRGIACNAVCPGWVDTEMARARIASIAAERGEDAERTSRRERDAVPIGRFVEPGEVARYVAFLCSPDAAAITGQALSICGGTTPFAG